ncbi:hypothetical protein [Burkholderia multivorans]|uniref:hypothetical protein n=1 Tax=Burkholderia multivorans TaxID=87883 RepID=UPI0018AFC4B4|nr:hypothetical protein [Burkholderia multivorans]
MQSIATFNWSIEDDFAIVSAARVPNRTFRTTRRRMTANVTAGARTVEQGPPARPTGRVRREAWPTERKAAATRTDARRVSAAGAVGRRAAPTHCLDALCRRQRITRRMAATRRRPIC